jgi:hypothetical protein
MATLRSAAITTLTSSSAMACRSLPSLLLPDTLTMTVLPPRLSPARSSADGGGAAAALLACGLPRPSDAAAGRPWAVPLPPL